MQIRKDENMENTIQKFTTRKAIAIILMALAFVTLNFSWLKVDGETLEEVEELAADFEEEMEFIEDIYGEDLEEALEEQGYSKKEVRAMTRAVRGTEKMVDTLEKGRYSAWSAISLFQAASDMKPAMTEGIDGTTDSESAANFTIIQVVMGCIVAVFALTGLLMILAIISHIKHKDSLGVSAAVLSSLSAVLLGFFALVMRVGTEEPGNGATIALILTPVLAIASCIAWKCARKYRPQPEDGTYQSLL